VKIYTKDSLIKELKIIATKGWISNARAGNHGGIGNTLEDLLGITENNLPIPNAVEWELKSQRINTTALTTLFHIEVWNILLILRLRKHGWMKQKKDGRRLNKEGCNVYQPKK